MINFTEKVHEFNCLHALVDLHNWKDLSEKKTKEADRADMTKKQSVNEAEMQIADKDFRNNEGCPGNMLWRWCDEGYCKENTKDIQSNKI